MDTETLKIKNILQGKVTKEVVQNWLVEHGYEKDRWGNFQKTEGDTRFRYKLSGVMARKEGFTFSGQWVRLRSGYYKKLSINANGQLIGMER